MITTLFLNTLAISAGASLVIVIMLVLSPFLNKRYAIKWKYLIWVILATRLLIPFNFRLPLPQVVIDIPTQMTSPISKSINSNNSPNAVQPMESNPANTAADNNLESLPTANNPKPLPQTDETRTRFTLLDVIACLWLAGSLLFLSVHLFTFAHCKIKILKNGVDVKDDFILRQAYKLSEKLQVKPDIRIMVYRDAGSPMVIGFHKPVLVLPCLDYSQEELYFILKHELVHIKRHDIYFKLLFVIANALHWFNPFIYVMQKEAVIDMELSCDEKVIRQTAYSVRKAYTETLFSTFSRHGRAGSSLTTRFYGGKKIMKKRFKNILTKSPKKNGIFFCVLAICITLISGMLVGCSAIKNDSPEDPKQTGTDGTESGSENNSGGEPDTNDNSGSGTGASDNSGSGTGASDNSGSGTGASDNSGSGTGVNDSSGSETGANDNSGSETGANDNSGSETGASDNSGLGTGANDNSEMGSNTSNDSFKSVILGLSSFISTDLGNNPLNINEIKQVVSVEDYVTADATKYAVVDLDGDGKDECILWIQVNGNLDWGFEILHECNERIYGYTLWYRAFMDLKTDGTYTFSGGAANSGVGKIAFSEDGSSISQVELDTPLGNQDLKENVRWFDLTEENITITQLLQKVLTQPDIKERLNRTYTNRINTQGE